MVFNARGIQTGPSPASSANYGLKFFKFQKFIQGHPISFIPKKKEKKEFSQAKSGIWFSVPWVFKQDHLQPVRPIFFWNFSNFSLLILGQPISFFPQKNEKKEFYHTNQAYDVEFMGHSNWTIFSQLSQFCSEIFPTFHFYAWGIQIVPSAAS